MQKTIKSMLRDKKGRFVDAFRAITVGNFFFFVVMLMVVVFVFSFIGKQIFGTKIISIGVPFQMLIVAGGLVISFYVIIKRQGALNRGDVFVIIFLGLILAGLFIYLPKLVPQIFSLTDIKQSILATSPDSPFIIISNVSKEIHQSIQAVIPIP